jgi:hypothetical protein
MKSGRLSSLSMSAIKVDGDVRPRRLVLGGGELTPRLAVDPEGLTSMGYVARRHRGSPT